MKAAWTIYRKGGKTFSQSLKKAWKWAKKNLSTESAPTHLEATQYTIHRETAKAVMLGMGILDWRGVELAAHVWIPKSLINPNGSVPQWFINQKLSEVRSKSNVQMLLDWIK
jgi:hypothetical protein